MNSRIQILSLVCVFYCLVQTVTAEDIIVTSLESSGAGTLRQAIADTGDGDTISFAPELVGQAIILGGSELLIENDITIDASSLQGGITVSGNFASRVFSVSAGASVTLAGLKIIGGATGDPESQGTRDGGGILTLGDLTLRGCRVSDNSTEIAPGGNGGGIAVIAPGRLLIEDCVIIRNSTATDFGSPGQGQDPGVSGGAGGGIFSDLADLTILRSTISGNHTGSGNPSGSGGGIYTRGGNVTISESRVLNNRAANAGFGDGIAGGVGGGIYSAGGVLVIDRTTISGNRAGDGGGARGGSFGGRGAEGGGIFRSGGTATISRSTVFGNRAGGRGLSFEEMHGQAGFGGGVAILGFDGEFAINNSTITGNSTEGSGNGLYCNTSGSVVLRHVTISGNLEKSPPKGLHIGGVFSRGSGIPILQQCIVTGNSAPGISEIFGPISEEGTNLIGGDAGLLPLGDYGGDTQTMLPLPGSAAVDGGATAILEHDQRGKPRAGAPDLGAVELQDSDQLRFQLRPISKIQYTIDGILLEIPTTLGHATGVEYSEDFTSGSWIELGNFSPMDASHSSFFDNDATRRSSMRGNYRAFLRPP